MDSRNYYNPRIETRFGKVTTPQANAVDGIVRLDWAKLFWVGSMLVFGIIGSALTVTAGSIVLFTVFTATTLCFGHSVGMHRRFIHRSYQCPRWLEVLLVHLGTLIGLAGPLRMLRTHDLRDWAQRQAACHDYFSHASVWYKDAYWQLFCSIKLSCPPDVTPEPEITNDHVFHLMEKTWMWQQLPWAFLFFCFGGWAWVFWGICSRVSVSILGHWLIGYFAHNQGQRDWHVDGVAVQGHNIPWTALLTMGENWHNNHHAFPNSAKLGLEAGQWDPGWWALKALEKCGLVSDLVVPNMASLRPELLRLRHSNTKTEQIEDIEK